MGSPALFKAKVPALMKQFMVDFQCTKEDAAAVFGNAGHESTGFINMQEIAPTVAGSRGGYGWFQWTGPRRVAFESYCIRNGLKATSDDANYKWLFVELKGSERAAIPATKRAKTLRDKVVAFEMNYERAGIKHYDSRLKWAQIALAAFEAKYGEIPSPSIVPDIPQPSEMQPRKSSWLEAIFSAVLSAFRKGK